ncbi:MAG: hypothetical protein ISF22_06345 [Methanomassiliicoccus sp.]|nr:hypothetical protein [Methanomassiliicoccus sp.]
MDQNQPIAPPQTPAPLTWAPPVPEKKSNKKVIIIVVAIVAVLVVAVFAFTMMNTAANVKSKSSDMTLKVSDLPSGWRVGGAAPETMDEPGVDWAYSVFTNSVTGAAMEPKAEISCQIFKYPTEANAKADFENLLKEGTIGSMTKVTGHFDQCWLYDIDNSIVEGKMYVFQERNVGGIILFTSYWGYDVDQALIDKVLTAQDNKIA